MKVRNKYFYRGMIRSVFSLVALVACIIFANKFVSDPWGDVVFLIVLIVVCGWFSTGLYYLIPFRYGSVWNNECKWGQTAFELSATGTVLSVILLFFLPRLSTIEYFWISILLFFVYWVLSPLVSMSQKRRHAPVRNNFFDRFLASKGIF